MGSPLLLLLLSVSLVCSYPFHTKSDEKRFSPELLNNLYSNPNSPYMIFAPNPKNGKHVKSRPIAVPVPENDHNCFFSPIQCLFIADPARQRL